MRSLWVLAKLWYFSRHEEKNTLSPFKGAAITIIRAKRMVSRREGRMEASACQEGEGRTKRWNVSVENEVHVLVSRIGHHLLHPLKLNSTCGSKKSSLNERVCVAQ